MPIIAVLGYKNKMPYTEDLIYAMNRMIYTIYYYLEKTNINTSRKHVPD